ncbi:CGGC domain-containing protein [Bacteroidetes/Chlorobi group bacterium ChocPot_Mid]|jgi:predicted metal-binding protein|nr:MAG: CGGC domain-containing protein [Bacteroidetes/Chlorobi group bacterium ChocPot_Mid]
MDKILIIGCKHTMDDVCIACSRCLVGFNRREGDFVIYKNTDAQLIGLMNCGDCPGASMITRLAQLNLWNSQNGERPTKVHIAPCILHHCPYKDTLIQKIKAKVAVEVIEGTHPYLPENIFA